LGRNNVGISFALYEGEESSMIDALVIPTPGCHPGRRAKKILVVEDEEDVAASLMFALGLEGYHCQSARTGPDAISAASWLRPDLVLLDLNLPGLDGVDVCLHFRSSPDLERMPVIMLTARATGPDRYVGRQLGVAFYVAKPFDLEDVLLKVRHVLKP